MVQHMRLLPGYKVPTQSQYWSPSSPSVGTTPDNAMKWFYSLHTPLIGRIIFRFNKDFLRILGYFNFLPIHWILAIEKISTSHSDRKKYKNRCSHSPIWRPYMSRLNSISRIFHSFDILKIQTKYKSI